MTIRRYHTNQRQNHQRMCQIVIHGDTAYLSGQIASDPGADITVQTEQVLEKIDALLIEVGSDRSKILSAYIWLSNMEHYAAMNEVWDDWIPAGHTPVRACVEARLAYPGLLVEISVIAAK
jgi:enamine deaminase RidA (YjgF/YER057c/UK114 family)